MTDNRLLEDAFADLSTALIADACVRLKIALRVASPDIRPLLPGMRVAERTKIEDVLKVAKSISNVERKQAETIHA